MAFGALMPVLGALYFQHILLLQPCVLCIYERCALLGIFGASILAAITPKSPLRYAAIGLWLYSAWKGSELAWRHSSLQQHPSPFATCDFFVNFPAWLPLDEWAPAIFYATGDCSKKQWQFLFLEMPQWLTGIFLVYLLMGILVLFSQFFYQNKTFK